MKHTVYMILLAWLVLSCNRSIDIAGYTDDEPVIFPDYKEVVVPINIAPLCFSVELPGKSALATLHQMAVSIFHRNSGRNSWLTMSAEA